MKRRNGAKFTLPSKYLLLILTVLCVVLMTITFATNIVVTPLNNIAGVVIIPFQEGISVAGSWLTDRSDELAQIKDVLSENKKLQAKIDKLTIENSKLQQDKYELTTLQNLYDLDGQYEQYTMTGARVIAKDSGNWFASFVIDKGSSDGIKINMNVMAGSGLVGRVVDVGSNWSKVKSIIADDSNVAAMVLSNSDQMIVSGNLEEYSNGSVTFSQLSDTENKVKVGDKVVTSNISEKFLPGILIGYINDVETDSNNLTKSGKITPAVDFSHINEVLIIMEKKQTDGRDSLKNDNTSEDEDVTVSASTVAE